MATGDHRMVPRDLHQRLQREMGSGEIAKQTVAGTAGLSLDRGRRWPTTRLHAAQTFFQVSHHRVRQPLWRQIGIVAPRVADAGDDLSFASAPAAGTGQISTTSAPRDRDIPE